MNPDFPPLTICDTGVILQATLNPDGPAERVLLAIEDGRAAAVIGNRLRSEYEDILTRPSLREKYPVLQLAELIEGQLGRIDAIIHRVPNAPVSADFPRDPNDAQTVNLAIREQPDFLITRDRDLLDLDSDPTFRRLCPHTRIVDPVTFLQSLTPSEE